MADKSLTTYSASQQQMLSWRELAEILLRRRRLILQITGWGTLFFILLALAVEPQYSTSAKLVVNPRVAETPVSAEPNTQSMTSHGTDYRRIEAQMHSAVAMLTSPEMIKAALSNMPPTPGTPSAVGALEYFGRVVRTVLSVPNRLYRKLHGVAPMSATDAMVGSILSTLKVAPIENSDLIEVTYTGEDPQWTATFVNVLIKTYLSPDERRSDGGAALEFFRGQRALMEGKLAEAQAELRKFREGEAGELAFADEAELKAVRLDLQTAKGTADTELSGANAQIESLETEIARLRHTLPVDAQVAETGPVSELKNQVMQLELEKSMVGTKYAPGSIAMRDIEIRLERARELLAAETRQARATFQRGGTEMEKLTLDLVAARTRKAEVAARVATLAAQIDENTRKLDRLDDISAEYKRLTTNVEAATESHTNYVRKEEEARFEIDLNDSSIMNIAVASSASVPVVPDPSAMWLTILFGTVLSLGTGAGIGVVRDRIDPTVKSPFEAERIASIPVISLLPVVNAGLGGRGSSSDENFKPESSI